MIRRITETANGTYYDVYIGKCRNEEIGDISVNVHKGGVWKMLKVDLFLYPPEKKWCEDTRVSLSTSGVIRKLMQNWIGKGHIPKWLLKAIEGELDIYFKKEIKKEKKNAGTIL